jgi:hypothetical protein
MDLDKISLIAQKIIFAFEDHFMDKEKRSFFEAVFNRYLSPVDPAGTMDPYDAIILLGRKNPSGFDQMIRELKEHALIYD